MPEDQTYKLNEADFNNLNYTAKAFGLALRRKRGRDAGLVHYVSFAGSNTACESMRATLQKRGAKLPHCTWSRSNEPVAPGLRTVKRKLPSSTELHYILWNPAPEVIIIQDPRMFEVKQRSWPDRWARIEHLEEEHKPTLAALFTQAINAISKAPMLPEWAETVMEITKWEGYETLDCYGDVVHAIVINTSYAWAEKIRKLLADGQLAIPPLASDLATLVAANQQRLAAEAETELALTGTVNDGDGDNNELTLIDAVDDDDDDNTEMYVTPASPEQAFLFPPGRIVATPGFLNAARETGLDTAYYLQRHLTGDWREPELDQHDIAANRRAARSKGDDMERVFSAFHHPDNHGPNDNFLKFWVITEADRSSTTFLLPSEY